MAKTKEELDQLKKEYEELKNKLRDLSEDEINLITGGSQQQDEQTQADSVEMRTGGDIYIG